MIVFFAEYMRRTYLFFTLINGLQSFVQDVVKGFGGSNIDPSVIETPLKFHAVFGSMDASWRDYMLPTFIIL
jgi:hypothetical protein